MDGSKKKKKNGPVQGSLLIQAINRHTSCWRATTPSPPPCHAPSCRPTGRPPQSSRETGGTTRIPVPLHPPWATTRFGIEYVGISRRDWPVFLPRLRTSDPGSNLVLRLGGERLNHYATCLTSRRTNQQEEEEWAGARELVDSSYQPTYVVLEGHNPIPSALSCTFLPANRQATSIFKGNGRTT